MFGRTKQKTITYDPTNFAGTLMAGTVYRKGDQKIRKSKTVTKSNGKVKTVTYGPMNYYGKQTKTKLVTKNGKTRTY